MSFLSKLMFWKKKAPQDPQGPPEPDPLDLLKSFITEQRDSAVEDLLVLEHASATDTLRGKHRARREAITQFANDCLGHLKTLRSKK